MIGWRECRVYSPTGKATCRWVSVGTDRNINPSLNPRLIARPVVAALSRSRFRTVVNLPAPEGLQAGVPAGPPRLALPPYLSVTAPKPGRFTSVAVCPRRSPTSPPE